MTIPGPIEVVAFDLDNTLYDEGRWFDAALPRIAAYLEPRSGRPAAAIEGRMRAILAERGKHYHHLFDDTLRELGLDVRAHLGEVLALYGDAPARIELFPGVAELLERLAARFRLGLITSGRPTVQERKIDLLGIRCRFQAIVLSSTLAENKPGRMPFERLLQATEAQPTRTVYVGDNPLFDFRGANELGMVTVRVRNPELDSLVVPEGWDARVRIEKLPELAGLMT